MPVNGSYQARTAQTSSSLNSTAAALLGMLHERDMSGWELMEAARVRIGDFWTLTRSQVYRELEALTKAGYVTAGEAGRRGRRPFAITETGREAFSKWLHQGPGRETVRFPLLLTLSFGAHLEPELLASFLEEHRRTHEERLQTYRALEPFTAMPECSPHLAATLSFGLHYEQAVLRWFESLPASLRTPRPRSSEHSRGARPRSAAGTPP
ncbi:MAG TPA: PadR family transcriptional regulator [Candidatus Sulfotelmatobacter sp.]|nr:PadR family transcriptional regulator [Candidatus Sulfotelmatobacter sp.]